MTNAKTKMRVTAKAGITVSFRRRVELFMSPPFGQRVTTPTGSEGATLTTKATQVNPYFAKFDALRRWPQRPFAESQARGEIPSPLAGRSAARERSRVGAFHN